MPAPENNATAVAVATPERAATSARATPAVAAATPERATTSARATTAATSASVAVAPAAASAVVTAAAADGLPVEPPHVNEGHPEHVVHMWQRYAFETPDGFDYLRAGKSQRVGYRILMAVLFGIFFVILRVFLGFRLRGKENLRALGGRGAVSVCNHVQMLDCAMVHQLLHGHRLYYLTIESNFRVPFIRRFVRWGGGVPLSPKPRRLREMYDAMGAALSKGSFVQVYPETVLLPYARNLRDFATGAFFLAVRNDAPVLPMVVTLREPRGLYRLLKRKPCVQLTCLAPIYPPQGMKQSAAIRTMAEECYDAMAHAIERIEGKSPEEIEGEDPNASAD